MELGIGLPQTGAAASPESIREVAVGAERLGLASVWAFERQLRPVAPVSQGGGEPAPLPAAYASVYDPLETLAFAAAMTSRITLGTSILIAPLHPPVVLGRRMATVDRLSGGRLLAGLGQGWMPQEFAAAGVPTHARGDRFEEWVAAVRAVWGPDPVRFDGRFYTVAESQVGPKPARPGGPPIIAGAFAPPALARAGRMGLGLNPGAWSFDALEGSLAAWRSAARAAGHDPDALPVVVRVNGDVTEQPLDRRMPATGSPEQVAEDLARLEGMGVHHAFWAMDAPVGEQLERLGGLLATVG